MSIESAKAFIERMKSDKEFAKKVNEFKTLNAALGLLRQTGYDFTKEELQQASGNLNDSDLNDVNGGAFPTAVNSQITDSIT